MPRASHNQTIARQWAILRKLTPRRPGITAREMMEHLRSEGFEVTKRTIERDLVDLSGLFPMVTTHGTPRGWRWMERSLLDIPGVDVIEALPLVLVGDLIRQMAPASLSQAVKGRLDVAKNLLKEIPGNRIATWSQVARYVPSGMTLRPPDIADEVLEAVETALIQQVCLRVDYMSAASPGSQDFTFHPLALILHGSTPYLLASFGKGKPIYQYPLHRFGTVEVLQKKAWRPAKFCLDTFLESGKANFGAGDWIQLEAQIAEPLAKILRETPLAENQQIRTKQGTTMLRAKVRDSWELHFWILSQGDRLTVTRPVQLRQKIRKQIQASLNRYLETDSP